MARYREFKPDRDTTELLDHAGVLRPGERMLWVSDAGIGHYAVYGRDESGRPKSPLDVLDVFSAVFHVPIILLVLLVAGIYRLVKGPMPPDERPDDPPMSIIFGTQKQCQAVFREWTLERHLQEKPEPGLWVLTEQRFLRVTAVRDIPDEDRKDEIDKSSGTLPLEPLHCQIDFEAESGSVLYTHEHEIEVKGTVRQTKQQARYRRITLEDNSGFDIHPDTITELEPYEKNKAEAGK